jgi:hypothetical protein
MPSLVRSKISLRSKCAMAPKTWKISSPAADVVSILDPKLLSHTSPLGWEHIILTCDFDWHSGAAERKIARPLHINAKRKWVG